MNRHHAVGLARFLVVACLAAATWSGGCGRAGAGEGAAAKSNAVAVLLTDDLGRTVRLAGPVERVAVLTAGAADLCLAIGIEPVLVPLLKDGQPDDWAGLDTLAVDHSTGPNMESLIAADPDLVVVDATHAQFVGQIERLAGAAVISMHVGSIADLARHTRTLGSLTGRPEAAEAAAARLEAFGATGVASDPVRVLAVLGTPHAFFAFLPDSYLGDLVRLSGGELVTEGMGSHRVFRGLAPIGTEALLGRDPDVLLVLFHGSEAAARAMLEADPLWGSMRAVREGRVFLVPDDYFVMRPGVHIEESLELVKDAVGAGRS